MDYWTDLSTNFQVVFDSEETQTPERLSIEETINDIARSIIMGNPQNIPFLHETPIIENYYEMSSISGARRGLASLHGIMPSFSSTININLEDYINSTLHSDTNKTPKVISEELFNTFSRGYSSKNCSICLEENGDSVMLPCKHCFHEKCIKKWLTEKSTNCPLCKHDCSS